jgi:hypothetical protein
MRPASIELFVFVPLGIAAIFGSTIGQHAQKLHALLVEERNESFKRSAAVSGVLQFFERLAILFACRSGMARPWFFGMAFLPWHLFP